MITGLGIRARLLLWIIISMSVVLLIFVCLMTWMIRWHLHVRIDTELAEESRELAEEIQQQPTLADFQARFDRFYAEHGGFSFEICQLDGTVLCGSPWLRAHSLPRPQRIDDPSFEPLRDVRFTGVGLHRTHTSIIHGPDQPLVLNVVTPHQQLERELRAFFLMLLAGSFVSIAFAAVAGLFVTQRVLDPLARMTSFAEKISAENLAMALVVDNPRDEVGRLAITLNETFQRLRSSLDEIRRFTSDAAHELRTPLAVMRTEAEIALRRPQDESQLRQSVETILEQARRLTALVDQLLMLSRHEATDRARLFEEVYLEPLLLDVVASLQSKADENEIALVTESLPACVVRGDDVSLSRVFLNLLDNAIKYTRAGGSVTLSGAVEARKVVLCIQDTGIGIQGRHLAKIFDRFYRVDGSRNECTGGVGLGLAICRSIVELHQGTISVASEPGHGTTFTVELPLISTVESVRELEEARNV